MADPDWRDGRYLAEGVSPAKGLAVARMAAHITYLSDSALQRRFGRNLQDRADAHLLLRRRFPDRILPAPSGLDLRRTVRSQFLSVHDAGDGLFRPRRRLWRLARPRFQGSKTRFCVVSFTSDWLFPTSDSRALVHALNAGGASVSFVEIETDRGHDAFLLDVPDLIATTRGFIDAAGARHRGDSA